MTQTSLRDRIIAAVKASANGMTTDELKVKLSDAHPQTVNSTTNVLAKSGILRDTGQKRETRAPGGRPAIVYAFDPNPKPPQPKAKRKSATVVDFSERKILSMIEDETICKVFEKWAASKSRNERIAKGYHLVKPFIGDTRGGIVALADVQAKEAAREGRLLSMHLKPTKKP